MRAVVATLGLLAVAAVPMDELAHAQDYFNQGDYRKAAEVYDALEAQGVSNGPFHFNQGNAHYLARQLPEAIRAWRLAEKAMPNDTALQANLAKARAEVLESPGHPQRIGPRWLPRLSRFVQVRLAFLCGIVAWFLLLRWLWNGVRGQLVFGAALAVFALVWGLAVYLQEREDAKHPFVVVRTEGVPLRKGNGETYPPMTINDVPYHLHRDVEARVLMAKPNGWLRVELANGVIGWLPNEAVVLEHALHE